MKMIPPLRLTTSFFLILFLSPQPSVNAKHSRLCPIGYDLSYTKTNNIPICHRIKGPEKYTDIFTNCAGNLYTSKLYDDLNKINSSGLVLWTEYKSAYESGPFVDVSFTRTAGSLLESSFDVTNTQFGIGEELCVTGMGTTPISNYTAERCDKEYYRYCFIEPYPKDSQESCEDIEDSVKFWSPKPLCLCSPDGINGSIRATSGQAETICQNKIDGGQLLYHGWRYTNSPKLQMFTKTNVFPLRVQNNPVVNITYSNYANNTLYFCQGWTVHEVRKNALELLETHPCEIIEYERPSFIDTVRVRLQNITQDKGLQPPLVGAIDNGEWTSLNSSYVFYDVICEKEFELENITLTLKEIDKKLILSTDKHIDVDDVQCYTDSVTYYPKPVRIKYDKRTISFVLQPRDDGNYWCINTNTARYKASVSNKLLWIREKEELEYRYAVKLKSEEKYVFENLTEFMKEFEIMFQDYEQKPRNTEDATKKLSLKVKEVYLDGKTVLVHVPFSLIRELPNETDVRILDIRPVHACVAGDRKFVNDLKSGCKIYSCIGSYNRGKQLVIQNNSADKNCIVASRSEVTLQMPEPDFVNTRTDQASQSSSEEDNGGVATSDLPTNTTIDPVLTYSPSPPATEALPTTTSSPPLPPEEELQQVMDNLEEMVQNGSTIPLVDIREPFRRVDDLLAREGTLEIPGRLLSLLDNISKIVELTGTEISQVISSNVALLAVNANPGMPVHGLKIAVRINDTFTNEAFEVIRNEIDCNKLSVDQNEAVVRLPGSVANSTRRVSFVVFRNDRAFQSNSTNITANSRVLSINVENTTTFENGEVISIYLRPLVSQLERNQSRTCAYWKILNETFGYWSQEGCTFIPAAAPGLLDACECTHLTHFAEILIPRTVFSELDEKILEILSVIGSCLSIFGLTLVGMTAVLFRSWRRDFNNKIWLQLCIAIFVLVLCFLITVFVKFRTYNVGCMLVGILLHYSVLASFCWMLVAAVISYRRLVMVFSRDATHKLLRASAFGWGFPIAVVGILLASAPDSYKSQFKDISPTSSFCYPSDLGLWLAVYAPIAVMVLANWTLFVLILRSVFGSSPIERHGASNEALRCASVSCLLVFLFGLPWLFGLFATNVVAAYFFAITASFQGFVLFIFFVVGNKKTRDLWLNKLKIKQTLKVPVTSSTYTNRSTGGQGPGWRAGAQGTVETRASKPKSLTNSDNSRFS